MKTNIQQIKNQKEKQVMKKIIIGIWIIACAVLLGGYVYYTFQASKEARLCYGMAYSNVRDGYMDEGDLEYVKRFVSRQHSIVFPGSAYERLRRYRNNLERLRMEAVDREMRGADNGTVYLHLSSSNGE
jgi:hypothetical protein